MNTVKLSDLSVNPNNPRIIKDYRFQKMINSLIHFPRFLEQRPIVHKAGIIYGGNQRFAAIKEIATMPLEVFVTYVLPFNEVTERAKNIWLKVRKELAIPAAWAVDADHYTPDELKAFVLVDNVSYGENDNDALMRDYDISFLQDIGVILPEMETAEIPEIQDPFQDEGITIQNKYGVIVTCDNEAAQQKVYEELSAQGYTCKIVVV